MAKQSKYINELISWRDEKVTNEKDAAYNSQISKTQKEYKDIDFYAAGADGKSLHERVLEHGALTGIKTYDSAFRDLYHDNLLKRAEMKAKDSMAAELQKRNKLGLLGETATPNKASNVPNVKYKNYDEASEAALKSLGW